MHGIVHYIEYYMVYSMILPAGYIIYYMWAISQWAGRQKAGLGGKRPETVSSLWRCESDWHKIRISPMPVTDSGPDQSC
jgi:hypothetical protein